MSDPLSISASIIGLLKAIQSLYGLIDSIQVAPEVLARVGNDLKSTDSIIEDLRRYLEASPQALPAVHALTDQKSALSAVLLQFKTLCDDFHKKLDSCVRHSADTNKLSFRDRVMTSFKKGSIEKFQSEVSKARQILSLRVDMINLLKTKQNTAAILDFQQKNEATTAIIMHQLADLDTTMTKLQELSDGSSEVLEKALSGQEAALKEQLRLCEENRAAADGQVRYKQEYGNTEAGDNSRNLQVLDLDKVQGSFQQNYGNTMIGSGTWSAQGAVSASMLEKFFYGSAAASQPEGFRAPGRRLCDNIVGLSDVQRGSSVGMKK